MNKGSGIANKIRFVLKTFLIITLIFGILSTTFGIGVAALSSIKKATSEEQSGTEQVAPDAENTTPTFTDPTEKYKDMSNTANIGSNIKVLSEQDSLTITSSVTDIEYMSSYYDEKYSKITLNGASHPELDSVSNNEIFFLQGDSKDSFGGDRAYKLINKYSDESNTYIEVKEPEFEEVFESIEYAATDYMSEENLVNSYGMPGITAHFGDIDTEMSDVSSSGEVIASAGNPATVVSTPTVQTVGLKNDEKPEVTQTTTDHSFDHGDLIITIDFDFSNCLKDDKKDDDKKEDDTNPIDTSFGIKGKFGIKDLATHVVFDVPSITDWRECYVGLSGDMFADINPYGSIELDGSAESGKKEFKFLNLEALNEKRFPIYVMQFQGTTPIYISNKTFEAEKKAVKPAFYIVIYADWEGEISLELSADFEFKHSFNSGLSIVENGKFNLGFQQYPYHSVNDINNKETFKWRVGIALDASTDLTILGGSLLFYIAGVNIAEICVVKLGVEAECDIDMLEFASDKQNPIIDEDASYYIRGYVKILQINVKIKAEGKGWADFLSADVKFNFTLLDLTLFTFGNQPEKFHSSMPISSMTPPGEFDSVIILVTDVSGSMDGRVNTGETKLEATKSAAKMVIEFTGNWANTYQQTSGIGIVQFASTSKLVAIPHIDYEYLKNCVDTLGDGGGTNIASGLENAITQLDAVKAKNKIIILMSDGQNGSGDPVKVASQASSKGIKIYTIGFGNDADAGLLTSIATKTGGEYKFASTESTMDIFGGFLYAQQSTEADVLADISSSVSEGETTDANRFEVSDKSGDLIVITAWPGSFLDTILIDPNGRVVDEDYPNSVTDESTIPSTIRVKNPIKGEWSVKIKGVETSYEKEPFYTIVSFKETEAPEINAPMTKLEIFAAYCIPVGFFTTVASILLLCCMSKSKKKNNTSTETT